MHTIWWLAKENAAAQPLSLAANRYTILKAQPPMDATDPPDPPQNRVFGAAAWTLSSVPPAARNIPPAASHRANARSVRRSGNTFRHGDRPGRRLQRWLGGISTPTVSKSPALAAWVLRRPFPSARAR